MSGMGMGMSGVGMVGVAPKLSSSAPGNLPSSVSANMALSDKTRQRDNEKCWHDVVLCCQKLTTHASRGLAQPLAWSELNEAMNAARHIMTSLVGLFQINSFAYPAYPQYAHLYSAFNPTLNGSTPGLVSDELLATQFQRFQQFEPPLSYGTSAGGSNVTLNAMNINNAINSNADIKKEMVEGEYGHDNGASISQYQSSYAFDDIRRRYLNKLARENSPEPNAASSSAALSIPSPMQNITLPSMSSLAPMSPPGIPMSSLSTLASVGVTSSNNDTSAENTGLRAIVVTPNTDRNNNSSSSSSTASSTSAQNSGANSPTRDSSSNSSNGNSSNGSTNGSGNNNWKKSRGKKRSKYSEMDLMCLSCGVKQTPEWRRGPAGAKTLCNACGLHWAKVLKAEGKGDQKKAHLLEQKRNQFMLLALKRQENGGGEASPIKAEANVGT